MSRFPPALRARTAIGCPWHGRTINDLYELGPQPPRQVATRPLGATWGPATPIKHPNAPGSQLDVGTDRDWGQYIGHTRSVNGADGGVGIGWNRWLYCDPSTDATWIMRAEFQRNLTSMDTRIYLDGVFGRFGDFERAYEVMHEGESVSHENEGVSHQPAPRLLRTFRWTPDIPSWNSSYGYTLEFIMSEIQMPDGFGQFAISLDGSEVFLHIYTTSSIAISRNLYGPTNEKCSLFDLSDGIATAGILKFAISGSNEAAEFGVDVDALITKDVIYEGNEFNSLCWQYLRTGTDYQHEALLYKTSDGTLKRDYEFNIGTEVFTVQYNIFGLIFNKTGNVLPYGGGVESKVFAQNAFYICTYTTDDYFGQPNTFTENWYGIQYPATPQFLNSGSNVRGDSYQAPSSGFPEFPPTRQIVGTYSPHNPLATFEIYTHDTSNQPYTGLVYQYV